MIRWSTSPTLDTPASVPGLHPLVGQALVARGLTSRAAAQAFLNPALYVPSAPDELPGLSVALERIQEAVRAREPVCVWGDFDVDGQTSTTILFSTLRSLGADVTYHIPVRARESHGVNIENLAGIIDHSGTRLVVTCDTGISAHAAATYARSRGVDLVITDHHDLPAELPDALAVVNPKLLPADHPLATLAGVGVAYKLAEGLLASGQDHGGATPDGLLDLAALGLVADLAILRGEARYLVQRGLKTLRNTERLGLKTMMELAELSTNHLTEEHIGFVLGPRLNALGRLDDANPAVELLTTADPVRARVLATHLEGLNARRKLLCDQVYQAAESQLRADPALLSHPILVLAHASWPGGVIGIVASRLVEHYQRPAILLSIPPGEPARGSARSVEGLNITAAISEQQDLLLNYGGHPMAAGLALDQARLPEFRRRIDRTVERMLGETHAQEARLEIDGWISLPEADLELAEQIERLAPFGPGNEKLTLASHDLGLVSAQPLGRNREHLKLVVEDAQHNQQTVLWWDGGAEDLSELQPAPEARFNLAYTLRASDWRGVRQAQLEFVAFERLAEPTIQIPNREITVVDFRAVDDPRKQLSGLDLPASTMIWAEAEHKQQVGGQGRQAVGRASTLVIWTAPPSREELGAVLEQVQPEQVVLFGIDPGMDNAQAFLERLAGLVKYTLKQRAGKTSYAELASATAQKSSAVRAGLDWLAQHGELQVAGGPLITDELTLTGGGTSDEAAAQVIAARLQSILNETSAYRANFRKADAKRLLGMER